MSALAGVEPWKYSLRDLSAMVHATRLEEWNHTASIMALLANINRKKGAKAYTPADFHPLLAKKRGGRMPITRDTIWALKALVPANKRSEFNG